MLGNWHIEFDRLPAAATVGCRPWVTVDRFLDDSAVLDQWRHLDETGTVDFRGATFRTDLPDRRAEPNRAHVRETLDRLAWR